MLFTTFGVVMALNLFLRPFATKVELEAGMRKYGTYAVDTVGGYPVLAPVGLVERWQREGVKPTEIGELDKARRLYRQARACRMV